MSKKTIPLNFTAAVVNGGTFTVNYPAGTSRGSFISGKLHKLFVNQALFLAPKDFTVSFGASSATVTYNGATPIAQGSVGTIEFDMSGAVVQSAVFQGLPVGAVTRLSPLKVELGSPLTALTTAFISAATGTELPNAATKSYTTASIGTSPADGANTSWTQDVPRNLTVTASHGSSIVATTVNVTGKDIFNQTMKETLSITATGTSKTATGLKAFYKIAQIDIVSASDSTANTISVGFGVALGLPVYAAGIADLLAEVQDNAVIGGPSNAPVRINWFGEQVSVLAGTNSAIELVAPVTGALTLLSVQVRAAVTTGGAVTVKIGTTDVLGLSVTVADAATKGTTATDTPTASDTTHLVNKGDRIQIVFADAFATAGALDGFLEIRPTGANSGTLVTGLAIGTKSTATTADVRGTYSPANAPDGTIGYQLLFALSDPDFIGNTQYSG